jgi:hypothetical protein
MQLRLVGSGLVFLSYYLAALCFNSQSSPNDGNLTDWIVIKLVRVPAGSFLMGAVPESGQLGRTTCR